MPWPVSARVTGSSSPMTVAGTRPSSTQAPSPGDARPRYAELAEDRLWPWLYLPVARAVERIGSLVALLQRGRISVYLVYSFATLLLLLLFVR